MHMHAAAHTPVTLCSDTLHTQHNAQYEYLHKFSDAKYEEKDMKHLVPHGFRVRVQVRLGIEFGCVEGMNYGSWEGKTIYNLPL